MHAEGLLRALQAAGHEAEIVTVPFKWYPPEKLIDMIEICRQIDLTEASGARIDLVIGLKFPAYYIPHPHKVLWILHQHRAAYDFWHQEFGDLHRFPNGPQVRSAIEWADREFLPESRRIFANSANVARRLSLYCGINAVPLYHPPPGADDFFCAESEEYLLFPSRIAGNKRQELVIESLTLTKYPVRVRFTGAPDELAYGERLSAKARMLGVSDRIVWEGQVSETDKLNLYAHAIAVLFPVRDEDLGYVTLEAMLSGKAVITCVDSGGPLEFVLPWRTGLVAEPAPADLAAAMDQVWENRDETKEWGAAAREHYHSLSISWQNVIEHLLA